MGRRFLLIVIILALGAGDLLFIEARWHQDTNLGSVTYVGIDSLIVLVPPSRPAAALRNGRWDPDLAKGAIPAGVRAHSKRSITLISLAPHPTYGNFLRAIRDLRARKKCNVLIREGDVRHDMPEKLAIPALVLCGNSIGDAGFSGTLPPDRVVPL